MALQHTAIDGRGTAVQQRIQHVGNRRAPWLRVVPIGGPELRARRIRRGGEEILADAIGLRRGVTQRLTMHADIRLDNTYPTDNTLSTDKTILTDNALLLDNTFLTRCQLRCNI